jgi:citrate synthase
VSALPALTTAQAAARLGVKPATLYAYVSRGLIATTRDEFGGSMFDALEVEALAEAQSRREARNRAGSTAMTGRPLMVLDSDITLIDNDELFFRGQLATELARTQSFEGVAELLWRSPPRSPDLFTASPAEARRIHDAAQLLGDDARLIDRLKIAVTLSGSANGSVDAAHGLVHPEVVFSDGRRILAAMVDGLPRHGVAPLRGAGVAARLWSKLTTAHPSMGDLDILNAALILAADHDLAASTLAARVAASARANPYAAVGAALGAFDSALHGGASVSARNLLVDAQTNRDPEGALRRQMTGGNDIPGFGHVRYVARDPRAEYLFALMKTEAGYREAMRTAAGLTGVVRSRMTRVANFDLALATLVVARGMRRDAGQAIFAIGRTVGWIAHIAAEYGESPLRLRPESRYRTLPTRDEVATS